ncbi:ergothioneine biosynthesis protein EgtB [bacterium]|nr:ergothioneine biosynthesis protein EgtB [bacterium]
MKVSLLDRFTSIRQRTRNICAPLTVEDQILQSMEDASPIKWHLAHTTWFFETFVLKPFKEGYEPLNDAYSYLFNSYYVQAGARFMRDRRGLISRPSLSEVWDYRTAVDDAIGELLSTSVGEEVVRVMEVGLNHEQQHQELMVTDVHHLLFANPLLPAYHGTSKPVSIQSPSFEWMEFAEGVVPIGHAAESFCYDNEEPTHRQFLERYALGNRPITNEELVAFIEEGGYSNELLWLSSGWALRELEGWSHPLFWIPENEGWSEFTLYGKGPLDLNSPVTHISYYEADAVARWMGARLPTEFEWEHASFLTGAQHGHYSDELNFYPHFRQKDPEAALIHMFGSSWEWTNSHYSPYPGYKPVEGALGEYNGKFMANQFVLRGGSCATPSDHIRPTYRNFFPAHARWQFSSCRLAKRIVE